VPPPSNIKVCPTPDGEEGPSVAHVVVFPPPLKKFLKETSLTALFFFRRNLMPSKRNDGKPKAFSGQLRGGGSVPFLFLLADRKPSRVEGSEEPLIRHEITFFASEVGLLRAELSASGSAIGFVLLVADSSGYLPTSAISGSAEVLYSGLSSGAEPAQRSGGSLDCQPILLRDICFLISLFPQSIPPSFRPLLRVLRVTDLWAFEEA